MDNSTPVATTPSKGFAPTTLDEAFRFAEVMSKSTLVPKDYQGNPSNCLIAMQLGMEVGLAPLQAMQNIAVINNRPCLWGDAMLAIVRASGLMEYINETPTEDGCTCVVKRKGEAETVREFTVSDAKKAGLYGKSGSWTHHPKRMMQMRARSFALRDAFTDVLRGMAIAEVVQDEQPEEKDITPENSNGNDMARLPKSNRGAKAREALEARRTAESKPKMTLKEAFEQIAAIKNREEGTAFTERLKAVGDTFSDEEAEKIKIAYAQRKKELAETAASQEIIVESLDNLIAEAGMAKTYDDLDVILDRGRSLDPSEYEILQNEVNMRKEGI